MFQLLLYKTNILLSIISIYYIQINLESNIEKNMRHLSYRVKLVEHDGVKLTTNSY